MSLSHLVIVSFQDPRYVIGGVQRRVAAEVDYFIKRNVEVTVITEGTGGHSNKTVARYITIPTPLIIYPLRALIFAARASQYLRCFSSPRVIETHHAAGAAALLAFSFKRSPRDIFVEVVHGVFRDELAQVCRHEKLFSRATLMASGLLPLSMVEQVAARQAAAVVTVSRYAAEQVSQRYGVPRHRIHVIPNGVDADRYCPVTRAPIMNGDGLCSILYVGRWHARKGVLQLLRAFALARQSNPSLRLRFVGGGPLEASLRQECVHLKLAEVVEFLGNSTDEQLVELYHSADIVCVPSLQEGQGIVALEAQACGTPVIATRAGGLTEVVKDRLTGLLVPPGDIEALASAMLELSRSPTLRSELGYNAVGWARSFAWRNTLTEAEALYERLLVSS